MRRSIIEEISSRTFRWIKYDSLIFDFSCLLIVIGISFKILDGVSSVGENDGISYL